MVGGRCFSQRNWVFDALNSGVVIFEMGGGHIHIDSTVGEGRSNNKMNEGRAVEDPNKWGSMLRQRKKWGSILKRSKKWGEDTLATESRVIMSTPPPQGVFGTFPYKLFLYL